MDIPKCTGCGRCAAVCPEGAVSISLEGKSLTDREKCVICGRCEAACPGNYRTVVGRDHTVDELVKICMQDLMFYEESGGGVTLSGGEVMAMDSGYIKELVKKLHREGVSIAIDTCGQAPYGNFEAVLPYVDTWLYDIKVIDDEKHREYMGMGNALILDNLKRLASAGSRIYIRIPVVKEVNGDPESMEAIIGFLKDNDIRPVQVNLLPYHSTGSHKYGKLGMAYPGEALTAPADEEMQNFVRQWEDAGYGNVKIGG